MSKKQNIQYCGNCGKYGHSYRKCLAPIISLGVILYKIDSNHKINYLLIQRKDTLGFVEFMRGKYNLENISYLYKLFEIMTINERDNILKYNFNTLWNQLWMNNNNKQYHNEYESSKKKFYLLKKGFYIDKEYFTLDKIHKNSNIIWKEPEWGFPKGRRNLKENDINCAEREFNEETGLCNDYYSILDIYKPIEETFLGTNNIRYKHIYYIAEANENINNYEFTIDKNNFSQVSEISNIKWFTFTEALKNIRTYNIEKKNVLEKINNILIKQ
jgi:8-oxo-dGTP pyrophosphatase MutT (NUDIX family)